MFPLMVHFRSIIERNELKSIRWTAGAVRPLSLSLFFFPAFKQTHTVTQYFIEKMSFG